jgi:spermidine/putrescine transport system permease protein
MAGSGALSADGRRSLILTLPPFLYAVVLLALPLAAVVAISFAVDVDTGGGLTLQHYAAATGEPINRLLLLRSVMVSALVTLATVVLAYPVAYFISFHVRPNRKWLWLFLITIPFWTSYLIRIFLWKVILGYSGVINAALIWLGLIGEPLTFILYNVNAVVITLAHAYAPFAVLPIFVALEKIDRSLLEASQDLGENRITTFLRVTLPLSVPGIVAAVLIVFIPTIGDYVTPELVGGPGGLLIANRIQSLFLQVNNPELGSALAIVTMASVGVVSLAFVFLMRRWLRART